MLHRSQLVNLHDKYTALSAYISYIKRISMTFRAHCYLLTLSFFAILNEAHTHDIDNSMQQTMEFNLPKIPKQFHFHDHTKIGFQNPQIYAQTIQRWQEKLTLGATKLFDQLQQEINLSPAEIYQYTKNEQILNRYHILKKSEIILPSTDTIIAQEDMDPEILNYLQSMFFKYTNKRNVTFYLTDQISSLTATYGSDAKGHYVFCHSYMYDKKHIQQYYDSLQNQHGYYYIEACEHNDIRWIEIPIMLQIGLIEAASHIQHQKNLIGFILSNYSFQGKRASQESINRYVKLETFHCLLEAVFQSRNPLEVAIFLMKMTHKSPDYKALWKAIVKDIAQCYDVSSLTFTKQFSKKMRQTASQ